MSHGHTIAITPADLHVEVHVDGQQVAESDRPVLLEETGMPTRYYLPRDDVRTELLRATTFSTTCPFKGDASYFSVVNGPENAVWSYESPYDEMLAIKERLAFYADKFEIKPS